MGKLMNGIFGTIKGKTGNLVVYDLKGQNVVRMKPQPRTHHSKGQLDNYQRMAVIIRFFDLMGEFLKVGFGPAAEGTNKNYHNIAVSYNKKHALTGEYPDIHVNYENVLLSQGTALPAQDPVVEQTAEGLKFSWHTAQGMEWPEKTDQVMMLAYFPKTNKTIYDIAGAKRIKGEDELFLDQKFRNKHMEIYISFVSSDRLTVADSTYLGSLNAG